MAFRGSGDGEGGAFFHPVPGMMVGKLINIEESGVSFKDKNGKDVPQMRWNFRLKDMAGNLLFYVNEGEGAATTSKLVPEGTPDALEAIGDRLTSEATGKGSNFRAYMAALLNRPIEGALTADDVAALVAEAEGKEAYLTFAYNQADPPRVAISGLVAKTA